VSGAQKRRSPRPDARADRLRRIADLRLHPSIAEVPALSASEFEALKTDIELLGVRVPVEATSEGVVLDGRARLEAAQLLGHETIAVRTVAPADDLAHILRAALLRRHLSASQKAALALRLVPYEELRVDAAKRQHANLRGSVEVATLPARGERTRELIAELAGASARTVQDVITVHDDGGPDLFEQVVRGQVSAHTAASKVRRAKRDAAIPAAPPLPEGPFELILADPPWMYGSPDSPFAPEQHYPTMPLDEIKALRLPAAEDCILFLWSVSCLLPEAFEVISAWGFRYRSHLVWVKNGIGPGVWLRQRHELLLVATRGHISPPERPDRVDSVIEAPRGRHSEKPDAAYERIERMYPHLPKLEMFARGNPRPGWAIWGNQAAT
jgi:N6-adenosine-specific RNA methylase IME4/ParB-like chromosome segregation protein Spo0J